MTDRTHGGEGDLAPVIPLFGAKTPSPQHPTMRRRVDGTIEEIRADETRVDRTRAGGAGSADVSAAGDWHTTWRDLGADERPVAPLPDITTRRKGGVRFVELPEQGEEHASPDDIVRDAEEALTKALRRRSLSEKEAHAQLLRAEVPAEVADEIIARFVRLGLIDDLALAEQLVHAATTRKKQGRRAVAQALSARGLPRELVDEVLDALPDDDAERALEFARSKARTLTRYDDDTAMRRLLGQLARRGFGGSLASSAARRALDEARRPSSGVRFR